MFTLLLGSQWWSLAPVGIRVVLQRLAKAADRKMSKEIDKVEAAYLLLSTGILPTTSDANAAILIRAGVKDLGSGRAFRLLLWRVTRKTGRNPLGDDAAILGEADLSKFFEALQMEGERVVNYRETVDAFRAR